MNMEGKTLFEELAAAKDAAKKTAKLPPDVQQMLDIHLKDALKGDDVSQAAIEEAAAKHGLPVSWAVDYVMIGGKPYSSHASAKAKPNGTKAKTGADCFAPVDVLDITYDINRPYLIKDIIEPGSLGSIVGEANVGKTFIAIWMAFAIALGLPRWFGQRIIKGGAGVLYIYLDGGIAVHKRIVAARAVYGEPPPNRLFWQGNGVRLYAPADGGDETAAETARKTVDRIVETVKKHGIRLVVIDTLIRALDGGDENSARDITGLQKNLMEISERTGAALVLVDHFGKDTGRGAIGSIRKRTNVDFQLDVTRKDIDDDGNTALFLSDDKLRESAKNGAGMPFKLQTHVFGIDDDGDEVSTTTVVEIDPKDVQPQAMKPKLKQKLGAAGEKIVEAFGQQVSKPGWNKKTPKGDGFPDLPRPAILSDDLIKAAMGKWVKDTPGEQRKLANNGLNTATAPGRPLCMNADENGAQWVWRAEGKSGV